MTRPSAQPHQTGPISGNFPALPSSKDTLYNHYNL